LQGIIIPYAILKIVFRHILFFWFFNAVWALASGGGWRSYHLSLRYTCYVKWSEADSFVGV